MEARKSFIADWQRDEEGFAELCRRHQISRVTGYKWVERFEQEGETGLQERSRAPHHCPQAMSEAVVAEIVRLRQQHPRWGPRKLRAYLMEHEPEQVWPVTSSMGELLRNQGLSQRRVRRRTPPYSEPLGHAGKPNAVWCADFKGWFRCGDGSRCDPLTTTDAMSRYLLRCRAVEKTDGPHVRGVFEATFRHYGLPDAIRTDNGPPFASPAPGGLSRLSMWWIRLGIRHERIEPGCPEQNGRHERMHQTLKQETASPPRATLRQQQSAFDRFEQEYNWERPHEALEYRVPGALYAASSRLYPSREPEIAYPAHMHVRWISQQGSLKWRMRRTFLSEVLARQAVGLLEVEEDILEVYYGPVLLGWLEADSGIFIVDRGPGRRRRR
jgi:transposase InsO family protein